MGKFLRIQSTHQNNEWVQSNHRKQSQTRRILREKPESEKNHGEREENSTIIQVGFSGVLEFLD